MRAKMKILVTGSSGLVGSAFKKIRNDYDYDFVFFSRKNCDLLQFDDSLEKIAQQKPDCVIHLAADVGGLYKNIQNNVSILGGGRTPTFLFQRKVWSQGRAIARLRPNLFRVAG